MQHSKIFAHLFALGFLLSACGSEVTTSPGGGEGGASGSTAANGTGNSSSIGPGATGGPTGPNGPSGPGATSGAGGGAACDAFCAKADQLACEAGDCVTQCSQRLVKAGDCADELAAVLGCMTQLATSCDDLKDPPPGCSSETTAFLSCDKGGCGPGMCSGSGSSGGQEICDCVTTCGASKLEVSCTSTPAGDATCECFLNGQLVVSCNEPVSTNCSLKGGCCAKAFF